MKTVFTNANDVIHLFAQRTQDHARTSNCFFYGDTIYSYGYHYELAKFIDDKTILINDKGYSSTTAKHIRIARYATRQYKQFFTTQCDIQLVNYQIKSLLDKLKAARKPEKYINEMLSLWQSLNEYITYTKNKNAKKDERYKEIESIINKIQKENSTEQLQAAHKIELKRKKEREQKQNEKTLTKFYNYEINSFRIGDKDYLRLSLDKEKIETNQGIKVYANEAIKLYKLILAGINIKGHRIGSYIVTSINGTLNIGCHNIDMDSVHKVGKQLEELSLSTKLGA
jgi:hypothetical protein